VSESTVNQTRVEDRLTESESLFLTVMAYLNVSAYQANIRLLLLFLLNKVFEGVSIRLLTVRL